MILHPFDLDRICPKCGFNRGHGVAPRVRFCRGVVRDEQYKRDPCKLGIEPPHFHRQCPRCLYEWQEFTLQDAGGPDADLMAPWIDENLRPFSERFQCDACGHVVGDGAKVGARYCPGAVVEEQYLRTYCPWDIRTDHLHLACPQCGYEWPMARIERPLAIGVATPDA